MKFWEPRIGSSPGYKSKLLTQRDQGYDIIPKHWAEDNGPSVWVWIWEKYFSQFCKPKFKWKAFLAGKKLIYQILKKNNKSCAFSKGSQKVLKYKLYVFFDNSNKSVCFYTLAIQMGFKTSFWEVLLKYVNWENIIR